MNRNIMVGLILATSLGSCVVGKKYARPDLQTPAQFRSEIAVTADSVQLPWRTFFNEPQLVELIEKALEKNNDIAIALKNMEQLDLAVRQAKLGLLPNLDLNVGASRAFLSKNSLNGSLSEQFVGTSYMDDYNASLQLTWEADIWGKVKMQKEAAVANYFGQKENLSALKTRIISQVAQAYYNLISLDEQLKIARRNIALSDRTLDMMRLQYIAGQINSLALGQAQAQKKTAELLVPLAMQNVAVQENALSILCGSYPDSIKREGDLAHVKANTQFASAVPAQLLSRRPDVKAAEFAVVNANAKTGLSKAAMYPTFSLSPQIGANSFKFNSWFDLPGSMAKTIAINLTQPIFQKHALKTAYETAALEQQKAVIQFKQTVLTAVSEVSDAMAKSKGASERKVLVEEKTALLNKATDDAMKLYKSGMTTYLEVITAQNNRLQNDLEAITIQLEQLNAVTDLYRALGGGVN
ncbi:TolC family protein [Dyadobacter sp. LHD-138]|uniref:TolC family protein n=1 Tax=Dyadobacter sp. LHD-138 TaxID=3071413 RepID=UPI0027E17C29|nr:TolC family protein [Dyadobacter sp. LHD-138]MDQ6477197.1 TolC family protein [Dyadobacter sp. LHD-138]